MTQFLRLSAKLTINLDRIDYINWGGDDCQIIFGCECRLYLNKEATDVLQNHLQGQGQGETDSDSELIHQIIGQALVEELESLDDVPDTF